MQIYGQSKTSNFRNQLCVVSCVNRSSVSNKWGKYREISAIKKRGQHHFFLDVCAVLLAYTNKNFLTRWQLSKIRAYLHMHIVEPFFYNQMRNRHAKYENYVQFNFILWHGHFFVSIIAFHAHFTKM